jgi:hypothetical protein
MNFFRFLWILRKKMYLCNRIRVVPHRSGYSTLKNQSGPVSLANGGPHPSGEHLDAGGLQRRRAPKSCETGVFTKSSARTRFFIEQ